MTTDERLENLVVTVENIAGIVKDLTETQSRHEEQLAEIRQQAEADRQTMKQAVDEMREGVGVMVTIAEEMKQIAIGLATAQQGTSQRVNNLESRVDALENPPQP